MKTFFAIKSVNWSHSATYTRAIIETFDPVHLTAFVTNVNPVRLISWGLIRGQPLRCLPSWSLRDITIIPQNEAGDTIYHTIDYPLSPTLKFQWWIMKGTVIGIDTTSISPILKHMPTTPVEQLWYAKLLDPDVQCAFVGTPNPCPHLNLNIVDYPPGAPPSWLRGTQTIGAFPNPGAGALFNIDIPPGWIKYSQIRMVRIHALAKRDHWSGIWSCSAPFMPSYLPQLEINGTDWYGTPVIMAQGWGQWWNYYELWAVNPLTGQPWNKSGFDNIQIGLQMQQPCFHGFRVQTYCAHLILEIYYWV